MINVLAVGDIMGRKGRNLAFEKLPELKKQVDFIVVNGENASGGFGINKGHCMKLFDAGADVVTLGNHSWDQKDIIPYIGGEKRLIRPLNYPPKTPGQGFTVHETVKGKKILVIQVMGRIYMDAIDDPFQALDNVLSQYILGRNVDAIIVDIHGEASSEKMALAHYVDGRVSLVFGTHTHIPTADGQILPGGTGYQTDLGMTGDYDSVIGMKKDIPIQRFVRKMPTEKMTPAMGDATLCGLFAKIDGNGHTVAMTPLRQEGRLLWQSDFWV